MNVREQLTRDIQTVQANKYTRATFQKAKEGMEELTRALNGGTSKAAMLGVLDALWSEHRYLQNEAIIALLSALANLAPVAGSDARNEFGIGLCQKIRDTLDDELYGQIVKEKGEVV
jgi:hypothetical protein